jgi:homopolymeric O-antigen transport system ATP-binding protein
VQDAIVVEGAGKLFRRYADRPHSFSEFVLQQWRRRQSPRCFWALRDVSFRVGRGRALGVIGQNGAGKSTLLRLVGGIGQATEGSLRMYGRASALLDLGSSFHHDLTGRENVIVAGVVAGLTRRQVVARFDEIVKFAELETFIDQPVRTFSSGMLMRLAFSVAVHTDPEILLVDEVLAVGDVGFQYKCLERIARFKENGCAILLVSHDMTTMEGLCDDILWLREGRTEAYGQPKEVIARYVGESLAETRRRMAQDRPVVRASSGRDLRLNENRFGSLELEITGVRILDDRGEPVEDIEPGAAVTVEIEYHCPRPISRPHFGVTISRADEFVCFEVTTAADGHVLPDLVGRGRIGLAMERLDLSAGEYFINVMAYEREWSYTYDSHWHVYPLRVRASNSGKGLLYMPHRWRFEVNGKSHDPLQRPASSAAGPVIRQP